MNTAAKDSPSYARGNWIRQRRKKNPTPDNDRCRGGPSLTQNRGFDGNLKVLRKRLSTSWRTAWTRLLKGSIVCSSVQGHAGAVLCCPQWNNLWPPSIRCAPIGGRRGNAAKRFGGFHRRPCTLCLVWEWLNEGILEALKQHKQASEIKNRSGCASPGCERLKRLHFFFLLIVFLGNTRQSIYRAICWNGPGWIERTSSFWRNGCFASRAQTDCSTPVSISSIATGARHLLVLCFLCSSTLFLPYKSPGVVLFVMLHGAAN